MITDRQPYHIIILTTENWEHLAEIIDILSVLVKYYSSRTIVNTVNIE